MGSENLSAVPTGRRGRQPRRARRARQTRDRLERRAELIRRGGDGGGEHGGGPVGGVKPRHLGDLAGIGAVALRAGATMYVGVDAARRQPPGADIDHLAAGGDGADRPDASPIDQNLSGHCPRGGDDALAANPHDYGAQPESSLWASPASRQAAIAAPCRPASEPS